MKKEMKISNMNDLRELLLETLQDLRNGDIDPGEAMTTSKIVDNVISTVNSQYVYSKLIGEQPMIPFMQEAHQGKIIEGRSAKIIEAKPDLRLSHEDI